MAVGGPERSRNDENMKFRYLSELRRLLGQKGWTDRDCQDLLLFTECLDLAVGLS